ncbi:Erg28-like protein [Meredithblackwellia eburnea MCA 4105]
MSTFTAFLPQSEGKLPYWMLFVSSLAVFNSIQNFVTTSLTRRVYNKSPASVSGLQARTFAVWTLASAFIRLYAAYNITIKPLYDLALISYVLALGHFVAEAVIFRTAGLGPGLLSPLVVASTSLIWMTNQYDFYVKA